MTDRAFWKGKTVLVTGGTGFLGGHVSRRLATMDVRRVVAVGSREVDLTSTEATLRWAHGLRGAIDLVFHLAVRATPGAFGLTHPAELLAVNSQINLNLLRAWHEEFPSARLIGIGSSCEYPGQLFHMSEDELWNGEPHPSVRAYAMTKRLLNVGQLAYAQQYQLDTVHVILTTLYGPGDHFDGERGHVVAALIDRFVRATESGEPRVVVWGDGYQTRECMYVEDQVDGLLLVAERCREPIINLGPGVSHTVRDIAQTIAELCGYGGEIVYDTSKFVGVRHKLLNIDRARFALGWNPSTTLREGLRRTIAWYRQQRASSPQPSGTCSVAG